MTRTLAELAKGKVHAWPRLVELLYADLRRMAGRRIREERSVPTLQPTELVHEAYLRLSNFRVKEWSNRAHFLATAAMVMRRILVERARKRQLRVEWVDGAETAAQPVSVDLLDLERALNELDGIDTRLARIVELRYFGGLTIEETAEVLAIAKKTVQRDWEIARAFLHGRVTAA